MNTDVQSTVDISVETMYDVISVNKTEKQMNAIKTIESFNLPTTSYIRAIQDANEHGELTDSEYRSRINEIVGGINDIDEKYLRHTYLYLIQEAIRSPDQDIQTTFVLAKEKAKTFVDSNKWAINSGNKTTKLDANGVPKKKKGTKKILAAKLWKNEKHIQRSRKEWIQRFVEEVGLTEPGASTYHANFKSGRWS